jgi:hypothetical protein
MNNLTQSRPLASRLFAAALLLTSPGSALAAVRYVDVNNAGARWPYTSWGTAASGIQEAIEIAAAGDEIVVTNGTYSVGGRSTIDQSTTTNRVVVDKPLALRSVNGPQSTMIDGGGVFRCVYLTNGASLSGFTLTNGRAPVGGGLWCESTNAAVSNCVVSRNSSFGQHPDFLTTGFPCCHQYLTLAGGVYGGTLNDCTLSDNGAETHSFLGHICDRTTCRTVGDGGFQTYYSTGAGGGAADAILKNCILTANWAGLGGGAYGCTLNNCTLVGNSAVGGFLGSSGGGVVDCTLNNCIVYFNTANEGANYDSSTTLNYSCTTPLPTNGVGNITNAPLFVDQASGNLRLQSNSPCINAGLNAFAPASPDLDGLPRIVSGSVDIGAYEYQFDSTGGTIALVNAANLPGGEFQFTFIGAPKGTYTVLMKTDMRVRVPWTVLGPAAEVAPGLFTFHEEQATNGPQRFYAVVNEFWPIETRACPGAGPNPCPCVPGFYRCIISRNGTAFWQGNVTGLCPCPPSSDF